LQDDANASQSQEGGEDNRILAIFVMDRNTEAAFSNADAPDLSTMHLCDALQ